MIKMWSFLVFVFLSFASLIAQAQFAKGNSKFKFFNRTELNYSFGINEALAGERVNAFQLKTIFGKQNDRLGAGFGIGTGTYRTFNASGGAQFNTIAFSANFHSLLFRIYEKGNNFFVKGGIGYAPRVFNGYDQGVNYDATFGYLFRTRKGGRYFGSIIYHHQDFNDFRITTSTIKTNTLGLGAGIWF